MAELTELPVPYNMKRDGILGGGGGGRGRGTASFHDTEFSMRSSISF